MAKHLFPFLSALQTLLVRSGNRIILWLYTGVFNLVLTIVGSLMFRTRMSHNNGIAAVGSFKFVDHPKFPLHPFFEPGKILPCRIRHGAASFKDDAMRAVRSLSIKLADERYNSPFDLELNTGIVALFWSAASFLRFAKYKKTMYGIQYHQYYRNYPVGARGAYEGLRRNPTSFSNLHYYSQTPFWYIASDQVKRYVKYRVIPASDVPETGILDAYDRTIPPENQRTLPGETRTRNYLKEEYAQQIKEGPITYKVQLQLQTAADDESPEIFNCCRAWDENAHPWMDLAEIRVERVLDWRESTMMVFSMNNMPKGLGALPAYSIFDYNSLNYMRKHSDMARKARVLAIKLFGLPPEIPDDDNRNQ